MERQKYIYSIDTINKLKIAGFNYTLDDATLSMINKIAKQVGAPSYIKTPIFKKHKNINYSKKRRNKNKNKELTDDEWELLRTFETGKFVKNNEGINKDINIIYGYLNKVTKDTYEDMKTEILLKLDTLIPVATKEDLLILGKHIFEISANNRFYSNLYADLFKVLINKYSLFKDIFDHNYKDFIKIFDNVEVADESDYETFCKVNKDNENRRSLVAFMVNLMNNDIIKTDEMIGLIKKFMNMLEEKCIPEGNKPLCDELAEIISISLSLGYEKLCATNASDIEDIKKSVNEIAEYELKMKTKLSLSNKTIFKFMDLMEDVFDE
jgi:hypothetical protein